MPKWWVYIIQSVTSGCLYTGMSSNVEKRLLQHNSGNGAKYTKKGRPWVLVYVEAALSKGDALRRELQIKRLRRADKFKLILDQKLGD